jgi:hypothetical protein
MRRGDTQVALLALTYQTLGRKRCSSPWDVFEYAEEDPSELSWCLLMSLDLLSPEDWGIVERLTAGEGSISIARSLHLSDPIRAEAVLHSRYRNGHVPQCSWAGPLMSRWAYVREAMQRFREVGLVASHWDHELIVSRIWMDMTGGDLDDYQRECERTLA